MSWLRKGCLTDGSFYQGSALRRCKENGLKSRLCAADDGERTGGETGVEVPHTQEDP